MNIKKILKDKKKRVYLVIFVAVLFMFYVSSLPDKKTAFVPQDVCGKNHVWLDSFIGIVYDQSANCIADGCYVKFDPVTKNTALACISYGEVGDIISDPDGCKSGKSETEEGAWNIPFLDKDPVRCTYVPPSEQVNDGEREIGGVVQELGLFKNNDKMAYYAAVIGGGLLLLMIIGVMF